MNPTISLKISFPELEKEIFYNFPRNITAGQLLEVLAQQGIIADRRLLAEYHIFVPWSGIWLNKQRLIDSYALVEEVSHDEIIKIKYCLGLQYISLLGGLFHSQTSVT
jgi:hypothetical protein